MVWALLYCAPLPAEATGFGRITLRFVGALELGDARPYRPPHVDDPLAGEHLGGVGIVREPHELTSYTLHTGIMGEDTRRGERKLAAILEYLAGLPVDDQTNRSVA